jgi:anti-anti-sigma factor
MAIGRSQALAGHDAATVDVAALAGTCVGATDLIDLSWRVSPDRLATVTVRGDLDLATADRTVRYIADVIDRHDGPVSVDLSELAFCDACGLGALIRVAAYAEQTGRRLKLASPSRAAARIMRLTGVGDWLLGPALANAGVPASAAPPG